MKTILVTGAKGQVGKELQVLSKYYSNFQYLFADREALDISNMASIKAYFATHDIDYCINCAAYTAVDKAEKELEAAQLANIEGAATIAKACTAKNATLLHLSTDYVYHNQENRPLREDDETHPKNVYAQTKLAGDKLIAEHCPKHLIIRTSWVYSTFGNNFVHTMLRLGQERHTLNVVFDQVGTPTYARDLANALLHIVKHIETEPDETDYGTYHFSNEGVCSWYDFARAIFDIKNIRCQVIPIETEDFPTPAKRPHYSVLNKAKIRQKFRLNIPHWRDSLKRCLKLI